MSERDGGDAASGTVFHEDPPQFPDDIVESAISAQATLAVKLAELRGVVHRFPHAAGPAAGDQWIDRGGDSDRSVEG